MRNRLRMLRRDAGCLTISGRLLVRHLGLGAWLTAVSLPCRTPGLTLRRVERAEQRLSRVRGRLQRLEEHLAGFGPVIFARAVERHMRLRARWEQVEQCVDRARLTPKVLEATWERLRRECAERNPGVNPDDRPVLCALKGGVHWEQAAPLVSVATIAPKDLNVTEWRLLRIPAWFHQALRDRTVSYAVTAKDDVAVMRLSMRTVVTPSCPAPDDDTLELVRVLWDSDEAGELFGIAAAVDAASALA